MGTYQYRGGFLYAKYENSFMIELKVIWVKKYLYYMIMYIVTIILSDLIGYYSWVNEFITWK